MDTDAKSLAAPADRLKKLLSSPKKETARALRICTPPRPQPALPHARTPCLAPHTNSRPLRLPQILAMASENEIDSSLLLLLDQNIMGARGAGQEDAAAFMEKIKVACAKYVLK